MIWQKSAKLEGKKLGLGVGNLRFPDLCMKHCKQSQNYVMLELTGEKVLD